MSKVYVDGDEKFDYDIYMNHILNYEGYRFFKHHLILMKKEQFSQLIKIFMEH